MALDADLNRRAVMSIVNLSTGKSIDAQFNPTEFEEGIEVNWNRATVLGQSHQPLNYVNTNNMGFTFDLYLRGDRIADLGNLEASRRFLQALCYPRRASSVSAGTPPRALFVWPKVISLSTIVTSYRGKATQFNQEMNIVELTVSLTLEEIRDMRLLSEDVAEIGTIRSSRGEELE